jgi:hypothetical protein
MPMLEFIQCIDGVDTVALQARHPELFNVTDKDGVERWTLRPRVRAALVDSHAWSVGRVGSTRR